VVRRTVLSAIALLTLAACAPADRRSHSDAAVSVTRATTIVDPDGASNPTSDGDALAVECEPVRPSVGQMRQFGFQRLHVEKPDRSGTAAGSKSGSD
jgi:hypothetical protein